LNQILLLDDLNIYKSHLMGYPWLHSHCQSILCIVKPSTVHIVYFWTLLFSE